MLSKIIIFVTRNNVCFRKISVSSVVNCFQKLLSSWHETTRNLCRWMTFVLWIAFKNYYLRDTKQLKTRLTRIVSGCELLSKIIIFVTRNNDGFLIPMTDFVVNCFQKLLSSWHETTQRIYSNRLQSLWIAFKNYYLRDTKQHTKRPKQRTRRCELLSKIIIFVTRNNTTVYLGCICRVVNCFQKLLSSWHETTMSHRIRK